MSEATRIVRVQHFQLHSLDHTKQGTKIVCQEGDHKMVIRDRYFDCGLIAEEISCSCGFLSTQHDGGGCWQHNHDKAKAHHFEDIPFFDPISFQATDRVPNYYIAEEGWRCGACHRRMYETAKRQVANYDYPEAKIPTESVE